jgi:hypothetical protein
MLGDRELSRCAPENPRSRTPEVAISFTPWFPKHVGWLQNERALEAEHLMSRKPRLIILLLTVFALLVFAPIAVLAQDASGGEEGLLLRVNHPVTVAENEVIDNVIVFGNDATVEGTVTGSLLIIDGDATITGTVQDDAIVVGGTMTLEPTAQVENVTVFRGELVRDPSAVVGGSINTGDFQFNPWAWGIFSIVMWTGMTLVVLVSGIIFAGIGARQLKAAGDATIERPGPSFLGVIAAWIVLPVMMFLVVFTLIGIPLGVGYFLFVLPVLWFLGYLVAGTQIGRMILRARVNEQHPYLAAILGLAILQLLGALPVPTGIIGFLAGIYGSGTLIAIAWKAWRGAQIEQPAPAPISTTPKLAD